jgi:hypothetical protein
MKTYIGRVTLEGPWTLGQRHTLDVFREEGPAGKWDVRRTTEGRLEDGQEPADVWTRGMEPEDVAQLVKKLVER